MTPLARLIAAAEAVEDAWDCAELAARWEKEKGNG